MIHFEKHYFAERRGSKFRSLIVVDIQPLYEEGIKRSFDLEDFGDFLSEIKEGVLFFYNGPETIGSDDSPEVIQQWLMEHNPKLEEFDWEQVEWYDKGYSFFRDWTDAGVSNNGMVKALRHMYTNRKYDSREVSVEEWEKVLPQSDFNAIKDALEDEGLTIWTPDISISELREWSGSLLCGGGMNECLKEIQILMNAFNIKYSLVDKFVYY